MTLLFLIEIVFIVNRMDVPPKKITAFLPEHSYTQSGKGIVNVVTLNCLPPAFFIVHM